jgi:CheY-like chemotaxis protein
MLNVILGYTELALERVPKGDPLHDDIREIYKAGVRSAEVTRQLLAFARKQTIAPEVIDINETIEGMLRMLGRLIGEEIDLKWLPSDNQLPVRMDPSQLNQILANLCVNARDAIAGVGKITIETGMVTFDNAYCDNHVGFVPGDFVLFAVSDTGTGMDKGALDNLFEPFYTTKEVGEGTGLGLATVYGIVKQNQGFINVYSEPDQGTTFKIYIPRYGGTASGRPQSKTQEAPVGNNEAILIVEDEISTLNLSKAMLERLCYSVLATTSAHDAVQLVKESKKKISLLLTDVVMPEINGRELADRIQSLIPDIKILFMSGYTSNVIAHRGVLEEGINFIQKPFSLQQLAEGVQKALTTQ